MTINPPQKYDYGTIAKMIFADYDAVRAASEDDCLYCLSAQQVSAILSFIHPLAWRTRWYSLVGAPIDQDWLDSFKAELESRLVTECQSFQDQITNITNDIDSINTEITNITNDITVINNSTTIINRFDYSVVNQTTDNTQVEVVLNFKAGMATAPIGKAWLYKESDVDADQYRRWAALVAACRAFVLSVAFRWLAYIDEAQAGADFIVIVPTLPEFAEGWIVPPTGWDGTDAATLTYADGYNAATDSTAVYDVACQLANLLAPGGVSSDDFYTQVAALTFTPGTHQAWMTLMLQDAVTWDPYLGYGYLGFLAFYGRTVEEMSQTDPTDFVYAGCSLSGFGCITTTWNFSALNFVPWAILRGRLTGLEGIIGVPSVYDKDPAVVIQWDFPTGCVIVNAQMIVQRNGAGSLPAYIEWWKDVAGVKTLHARTALTNSTNGTDQTVTITPTAGTVITRVVFYSNTAWLALQKGTSGPFSAPTYYVLRQIKFTV